MKTRKIGERERQWMYPHFQQSKSFCKVISSKKSPFSLDEVCKINVSTTNDHECKHHVPSILEKDRCKTSQRLRRTFPTERHHFPG